MKHSIKEIRNELLDIGNRANRMEGKISDIEDRNLEIMQREEERDLSIKTWKKICKNYLNSLGKAI